MTRLCSAPPAQIYHPRGVGGCGFGTGAFVKCLPVLAAPVFLCALIAVYSPPVKTRTTVIASALCAAAAVAIIIAVAVNFFPASV